MNKINLLFIVFLLLNFTMLAQQGWFEQNHLPTVNTLRDVDFVNATTGWAVGGFEVITRTTDGGINWTTQTSGTTNYLTGVSFTDSENGIAVGDGGIRGIILRTTDGGKRGLKENICEQIVSKQQGLAFCGGDPPQQDEQHPKRNRAKKQIGSPPAPAGAGTVGKVAGERIIHRIPNGDNDPKDTDQSQVELSDVGEKDGVPERDDRPRSNGAPQATDGVSHLGAEGEFFIGWGGGLNCICSRKGQDILLVGAGSGLLG